MSALFFPIELGNADAVMREVFIGPAFMAYSSGVKVLYVRQAVDPLDLKPLIEDSGAKPSMLALREDYSASGIPERYFSRYYREDGSDFFVGTCKPSQLTFPPL